ncbi:Glutathione S-transferase T3 [Linum perenne]
MQQQYTPQSMPTPPADTRPDDMVESDGMINDESHKRWTVEDDKLLASSYLIISTDSVKGNGQNKKDFRERITKYFNDHVTSGNDRTQQSLKSHWFNIIPSVNEFNQCFIQTKRQNHSGWSDDQVMGAARELFYSMRNKHFKYEHEWMMVKDELIGELHKAFCKSFQYTKLLHSLSSKISTSYYFIEYNIYT